MIVGVPGLGIGGVFYILSALAMPFRELARGVRPGGAPRRWRVVADQTAMALAILGSIALVGIALGWVVGLIDPGSVQRIVIGGAAKGAGGVPTVLKVVAAFLVFGTLAAVLAAVQVLRLVVRRP